MRGFGLRSGRILRNDPALFNQVIIQVRVFPGITDIDAAPQDRVGTAAPPQGSTAGNSIDASGQAADDADAPGRQIRSELPCLILPVGVRVPGSNDSSDRKTVRRETPFVIDAVRGIRYIPQPGWIKAILQGDKTDPGPGQSGADLFGGTGSGVYDGLGGLSAVTGQGFFCQQVMDLLWCAVSRSARRVLKVRCQTKRQAPALQESSV